MEPSGLETMNLWIPVIGVKLFMKRSDSTELFLYSYSSDRSRLPRNPGSMMAIGKCRLLDIATFILVMFIWFAITPLIQGDFTVHSPIPRTNVSLLAKVSGSGPGKSLASQLQLDSSFVSLKETIMLCFTKLSRIIKQVSADCRKTIKQICIYWKPYRRSAGTTSRRSGTAQWMSKQNPVIKLKLYSTSEKTQESFLSN